jgi:hypothetical protein
MIGTGDIELSDDWHVSLVRDLKTVS